MPSSKNVQVLIFFFFFVCVTGRLSAITNKYWIASGSSNWNNTLNWSLTSGGSGGAGVPGSTDIANFDGNGLGNCSIDATVNVAGISTVAAYTGTISQNASGITVGTSNAVFSGGTFTGGNAALKFTGTFTLSGALFASTSATCTFQTTTTFSSGTFAHNNGTVTLGNASSPNFTVTGTFSFYNLSVFGIYNNITLANNNAVANNCVFNASSGDINIFLSTLTVTGNTSFTGTLAVRLKTGTLVVQKDVTSSFTGPTYGVGAGTILFSGAVDQLLNVTSAAGSGELPNVTINKTGGTLTLKGTVSIYGNWTYTAGTVDVTTNSVTVQSTANNLSINTSGTSSTMSFYNFTIGANSAITMASNLTILNNLTLVTPTSTTYLFATNNGYTLTIGGNFSGQTGTSFSMGNSTVVFNGTAAQTALFDATGGYINVFYNLTVANTSGGLKLLTNNFQVQNNLTLTSGAVNLNGLTLTLGTNGSTIGTLTRTAGWVYGGTFTRWLASGSPVSVSATTGLFPMGSSAEYCPFTLGYSSGLTSGGTASVIFNPYTISSPGNPTTSVPIDSVAGHIPTQAGQGIADASWGKTFFSVSNSYWAVTTSSIVPNGNTFNLRYGGGTSTFFSNTGSDLAAETAMRSIATTDPIYGSWSATTSNAVAYEVNRTGVSLAGLTNTNYWRIGTTDRNNSPLPIELMSFSAVANGNKVDLKWETITETNNAFFTIEKSKDGKTFTKLIDIPGANNSITYKDYIETDYQPFSGASYYRLKQTDYNGKFKYMDMVPVNFSTQQNITVYPSPIDNATNLKVGVVGYQNQNVAVVLRDLNGREFLSEILLTETNNQHFVISDTKSLSPGTYLVTASTNDKIYNYKIIVK